MSLSVLEREGSLFLLTSIIGRGGHLRGWKSEGASQAFCQAWWAGLTGVLAAPSRGSLTRALVSLPCLDYMDDVVLDYPMDHLSLSLVPLSSIKSSSRVQLGRGGDFERVGAVGKIRRGRASQGFTQPQLIYSPKRRKGGRGVRRGMDGNACGGEEEKIFLPLQNTQC